MAYGGDPYGHGVLVVVRAGESPAHGEGGQVSTTNNTERYAECRNAETVLNVIRHCNDTGEPDAVKVARPVRRGADGKVLR